MPRHQFAEYVPEVRGQVEIAILVELLILESRPFTIDLSSLDAAAEREHNVGMAVIGTAIAILFRGAAELAHGYYGHIRHPVTQVAVERSQRLAEVSQQVRKLAWFI